jgi:hypothetical protein
MKMGIIGRKLGMSQVFSEDGGTVPVTVIEMEPSLVIQKKTKENDGYDALQLGYGRVGNNKVTKPLSGHFQKADKGCFKMLAEFRADTNGYELGQEIGVDFFKAGEWVGMDSGEDARRMAPCFTVLPVLSVPVLSHPEFSEDKNFPGTWEASGKQCRISWYGRLIRAGIYCWLKELCREAEKAIC